ncbi:hypothetical protein FNW02_37080 [Komarekiella sp. 'clone 1']|uniref:Uncharacterized protein n=1 Tax=Komarekiella delphini-convector SJRDD-AB1 TaxID=2593771 RepID=A0AA40VVQ2_9NOST|nr:hypothetical protein [Komarekiella delphini-convector]MBD6621163.1 hypothetical protein [Komarekiella delphini-convector SJRDD-AB1]
MSAFVSTRALFLFNQTDEIMKLSYNQKIGKFVVSELGRILDSDIDLDALATRYGFIAPSVKDEMTDEEAQEMVDDFLKCE